MIDDGVAEPAKRGDQIIDREENVWERGNKGWWHSWSGRNGGPGKLRWTDLQRSYGPVRYHRVKGVTA